MKKQQRIMMRILTIVLCAALLIPMLPMNAKAVTPGQAGAVGIDVSKYQGNVDWNAVRNSGVTFAFIKAYSSYSGVDPYFARNITGANAAGIRTGVYVYSYATTVEEAVAEANAVIGILQNYTVTFPVAIDIEDSSQKHLSPEQLAAIANAFCATVENAGYYPMVYASKYWFQNRIAPVAYDVWVAQYAAECEYPGIPSFWQYSNTGSIPGIAGAVDMNYQYRDYSFIVANGFSQRGGNTYFYRNYRWQRGWIDYNGARYYCDVTGVMRTGWIDLGGAIYYLGEDGVMSTGLRPVGDAIYYFGTDGIRKSGLFEIEGQHYLFDAEGKMFTGWHITPEGTYYFSEIDGHMMKGWYAENGKMYFFDEMGHMVVGFREIDGFKYYFSIDGTLQTGWLNLNEGTFYMNEGGQMYYGWLALPDGIYYLDPENGNMHRGWLSAGGNTWFFDLATGKMQTGWVAVGENMYYFNPDGTLFKGVYADAGGIKYCDPTDGHLVVGFVEIGGNTFFFDPASGGYMLINTTVTIGEQVFLIDANGFVVGM